MSAAPSPFSIAFAQGSDPDTLLTDCLQQLATQAAGNVGVVYASEALADKLDSIISSLRQATGIADWIGSIGYGICANSTEVYERPAMVVMLLQLPPGSFKVFSGDWHSINAFRSQYSDWYAGRSATLAQVHGSPGAEDMDQLIQALANELPAGFLAGGLASAQSGDGLHIANRVESRGLSGLLLDLEQVSLQVRHTQGCHPIGPIHQVSESFRNVLVKLDGQAALDVLKQDVGELLSRNLERSLGTVLAGLMVAGSDTGDYLARHLAGVDPDRALVAVGDWVKQGSALQFCRRDPEAAEQDLERIMTEITKDLNRPARGALYVACVGRGRHMFGDEGAELAIIQRYLGNIPLAGFFANGEVYHQRLYGYTGVLTLFL